MQKVHKELSKHIVGTHGISRNPVVPMMEQTIFFNNLDLILKTLLGNKGHSLTRQYHCTCTCTLYCQDFLFQIISPLAEKCDSRLRRHYFL